MEQTIDYTDSINTLLVVSEEFVPHALLRFFFYSVRFAFVLFSQLCRGICLLQSGDELFCRCLQILADPLPYP